jgi:hypothetical protein
VNAKVLELLRASIGPALLKAWDKVCAWSDYNQADIDKLLDLCRVNRLGIHVLESAKLTNSALPEYVRYQLQETQRAIVGQNSQYLQTVRLAAAALKRHNIHFGVYKGGLGQNLVYGNYFTKKTTDVDVFVRQSDYNRAAQVLSEIGFEAHESCKSVWWTHFLGEQHFPPQNTGLLPIDLHSRCYQPGCPRPKNPDYFMEILVSTQVGTQAVPTLNLVSNCLYTAMSLSKAIIHREPSGKYIADLAISFSTMSAPQIKELVGAAREQHMLQCLAFASECCNLVFGVELDSPELPASRAATSFSSEHLMMAILMPDNDTIAWPQRTKTLIDLTDHLISLPTAIAWKFSSELL